MAGLGGSVAIAKPGRERQRPEPNPPPSLVLVPFGNRDRRLLAIEDQRSRQRLSVLGRSETPRAFLAPSLLRLGAGVCSRFPSPRPLEDPYGVESGLWTEGSLGPLGCLSAAGGGADITQRMGQSPIAGVEGSQLWGLI